MKFFIDEKKVDPKRPVLDNAASKIAAVGSRLQRGFATHMNKTVNEMTVKRIKVGVVLFILAYGGVSGYFIVDALTASSNRKLQVEPINVPKHANKAGDEGVMGNTYVDDETFRNITAFQQYMDSLKVHKLFRYDSIMAARPQLMDSIAMLEKIYNLQKQNSEYEK